MYGNAGPIRKNGHLFTWISWNTIGIELALLLLNKRLEVIEDEIGQSRHTDNSDL